MKEKKEKLEFIQNICQKRFIHLADILIALGKKRELVKEKYDICTKGYITKYVLVEGGEYKAIDQCDWDLQKPFLEGQEEEVINWIYKMLINGGEK